MEKKKSISCPYCGAVEDYFLHKGLPGPPSPFVQCRSCGGTFQVLLVTPLYEVYKGAPRVFEVSGYIKGRWVEKYQVQVD